MSVHGQLGSRWKIYGGEIAKNDTAVWLLGRASAGFVSNVKKQLDHKLFLLVTSWAD